MRWADENFEANKEAYQQKLAELNDSLSPTLAKANAPPPGYA